jgi:hypothetical protein
VTQPFPLQPGPIGRVRMTRADLNTMTPAIEQHCADLWVKYEMFDNDLFWRPSTRGGQVGLPSGVGGPNWGLSYDPTLGYVFINLHNTGRFVPKAAAGTGDSAGADEEGSGGRGGGRGQANLGSGPRAPSAGTGAANRAVDVNKGEIAWKSTLGINPFLSELGEIGIKAGARNLGGSIATASGLVFIAATNEIWGAGGRGFESRHTDHLLLQGESTRGHYLGSDTADEVTVHVPVVVRARSNRTSAS